MEKIIFYILAFIIIVFAIASVSSKKMLRSVIYLLFVLCGIAGIYFLIDYNFLAAIQLTVYAGGVIVLLIFSVYAGGVIVLHIFSIMLVHHIEMELELAKISKRILVGFASLIGLGIFLTTIYSHEFTVIENSISTTTENIGLGLLSYEAGGFILPFEVISVLLLASMIGAIIIAKGGKVRSQETEVGSEKKE